MLLTVNDAIASQIGTDRLCYKDTILGSTPPFKVEATVSAGYTDITSIVNWNLYGALTDKNYQDLRNILIDDFLGDWATLSDADKTLLVEHYIYPAATTQAELDALMTVADQDAFRHEVIDQLSACDCGPISKSTTAGSNKFFKHEIDDTAAISAAEVLTHQTI